MMVCWHAVAEADSEDLLEKTRQVWLTLIRLTSERTGHGFDSSDELGLADLLAGCEQSAAVRDFFGRILRKERPSLSPPRRPLLPGERGGHGRHGGAASSFGALSDAGSEAGSVSPPPRKPRPPGAGRKPRGQGGVSLKQSASAPVLPAISERSGGADGAAAEMTPGERAKARRASARGADAAAEGKARRAAAASGRPAFR